MFNLDVNVMMWFIIAVSNLVTAVLAYRTHQVAAQTGRDMSTVERATNSMKDALVAATARASFAEGLSKGNIEGNERAAAAAAAARSTPQP